MEELLGGGLRRRALAARQICFIFDGSKVLSTAFLERINALLASGEVLWLFDGDEHVALINQCKEAALKDGKTVDTEKEIYKRFTFNVQRNLQIALPATSILERENKQVYYIQKRQERTSAREKLCQPHFAQNGATTSNQHRNTSRMLSSDPSPPLAQ